MPLSPVTPWSAALSFTVIDEVGKKLIHAAADRIGRSLELSMSPALGFPGRLCRRHGGWVIAGSNDPPRAVVVRRIAAVPPPFEPSVFPRKLQRKARRLKIALRSRARRWGSISRSSSTALSYSDTDCAAGRSSVPAAPPEGYVRRASSPAYAVRRCSKRWRSRGKNVRPVDGGDPVGHKRTRPDCARPPSFFGPGRLRLDARSRQGNSRSRDRVVWVQIIRDSVGSGSPTAAYKRAASAREYSRGMLDSYTQRRTYLSLRSPSASFG